VPIGTAEGRVFCKTEALSEIGGRSTDLEFCPGDLSPEKSEFSLSKFEFAMLN
jgi:hypothetical protein